MKARSVKTPELRLRYEDLSEMRILLGHLFANGIDKLDPSGLSDAQIRAMEMIKGDAADIAEIVRGWNRKLEKGNVKSRKRRKI